MKRIKYNWLSVIDYYALSRDFDRYAKQHQNISINRAARGFVLKKKLAYKFDCFKKYNEDGLTPDQYFQKLAQVKWIED